jgi:uncharacterized protein (TIGR02284 family)
MKKSKVKSKSSLEVLKDLLKMYKSRVIVYNEAAKEIKGATLRCLFSRLAQTGKSCEEELSEEVMKRGGTFVDLNEYSNEIKMIWLSMKVAIAGNNGKAIFDSCEYEEQLFGKIYEQLLKEKQLRDIDLQMIQKQYALIKEDLGKIRNLRNVFVKA